MPVLVEDVKTFYPGFRNVPEGVVQTVLGNAEAETLRWVFQRDHAILVHALHELQVRMNTCIDTGLELKGMEKGADVENTGRGKNEDWYQLTNQGKQFLSIKKRNVAFISPQSALGVYA